MKTWWLDTPGGTIAASRSVEVVARLLEDVIKRMDLNPRLAAGEALEAYNADQEPVDEVLSVLDALDVDADESGPDVVAQMRAALAPGWLASEMDRAGREELADWLESVARAVRAGHVKAIGVMLDPVGQARELGCVRFDHADDVNPRLVDRILTCIGFFIEGAKLFASRDEAGQTGQDGG